jgi:drug/metabolite transporter (DMT)-like permease
VKFKLNRVFTSDTLNSVVSFRTKQFLPESSTTKAYIALGIVSLIWGTTWVVSKQGVSAMPALQLAGIRQIIAGMIYLIYYTLKGTKWPGIKDMWPLIVLAFLNFVFSNGLSTWGVKYISAGLGSIIGAVFPLWLVVIGLMVSGTKTPRLAVYGLLVGFAGISLIFYDHLHEFLKPEFRFGILLSVLATWTWALGTLYTKSHAKVFNPYFGLGFQMLIAGFVLLTVSMISGDYIPLSDIPDISWFSIVYLIIFGSIIGFISYLYALQNLPTEQASIYAYINPVIAVLAGVLIFNERFNTFIILGGLAALYGVYIVNQAFRKKNAGFTKPE